MQTKDHSRRVIRVTILIATLASASLTACSDASPPVGHASASAAHAGTGAGPTSAVDASIVTFERAANPARTLAKDDSGAVVATFTDGARTVVLRGPERTFEEPSATEATVTTTAWVRLAPQAWKQGAEQRSWFEPWFQSVLGSEEPDVFARAFEYVKGAPDHSNEDGVRISGDALFGPLGSNGQDRLEANDFYDYLGVSWRFPDVGRVRPESRRYGSLDCSGFVRMVLGYRLGYPLRGSNGPGPGLPRRAFAIQKYGAGVEIVPDREVTATAYDSLQPGDLVFFQTEGGPQIDHMGIYLGVDSNGGHRFMSSRVKANGPTMGDIGGTSLLDDEHFYSRGWRAARRV
jgi:cell wall-associated NlpC family hydrolase